MGQDSSTPEHLRDKRLQNLLDNVTSYLHAEKKKQLFEAEIRKATREIEYIEDKIAVARKQFQKAVEANREIEPRLHEAKRKLSHLQKERDAAENEYAMLKAIEEDTDTKLAMLRDIENQITHVRKDVGESSHKLKALRSMHAQASVPKENLEKETGNIRTKLSGLENEIPVMRNTRDILAGVMPEGSDPDTFDAIQNQAGIEKAINDYVTEVKEQIGRVKKEASDLSTQIDAKHASEKLLLSEKEDLQSKMEDVMAELRGEVKKTTIVNELNRLQEEKERLVAESERMTKEVNGLDSGIKILDDELKQGKKLERDLMEKHGYLTSRKQEMDEFDNIDAEIERVRNEAQDRNTDSDINDKLIGITNDIKQDLASTNGRLRSDLGEYNKIFLELDQTVNSLLSP